MTTALPSNRRYCLCCRYVWARWSKCSTSRSPALAPSGNFPARSIGLPAGKPRASGVSYSRAKRKRASSNSGKTDSFRFLPSPAGRGKPGDQKEVEVGLLGPSDVVGGDLVVVAGIPTELRGVGDGLVRPALLVIPRIVVGAEKAFGVPSLRLAPQRHWRPDNDQ